MSWMNSFEIDNAAAGCAGHPVLGPATQFLRRLKNAVNAQTDGWHSWPAPGQAADGLQQVIIDHTAGFARSPVRNTQITLELVRDTLKPIRAMVNKQRHQFKFDVDVQFDACVAPPTVAVQFDACVAPPTMADVKRLLPALYAQIMEAVNEKTVTHRLKDVVSSTAKEIEAKVLITDRGILINFTGYGEACAEIGYGQPVMIEIYNGHPRVVVWSDINQEDPTHIIPLEGAQERLRKPDACVTTCDECGNAIPDSVAGGLTNKHHAGSCSLYDPNTD